MLLEQEAQEPDLELVARREVFVPALARKDALPRRRRDDDRFAETGPGAEDRDWALGVARHVAQHVELARFERAHPVRDRHEVVQETHRLDPEVARERACVNLPREVRRLDSAVVDGPRHRERGALDARHAVPEHLPEDRIEPRVAGALEARALHFPERARFPLEDGEQRLGASDVPREHAHPPHISHPRLGTDRPVPDRSGVTARGIQATRARVRVLGVDPGSRRIGLAISDEDERIALPHSTVNRQATPDALASIAEVVRAEGVGHIVVGLPLRLDGADGPEARRARAFADALGRATGIPVELVDERLTTALAERALRETGVKGARKKDVINQAAATVLLQGYLEKAERSWDHELDPEAEHAERARRREQD